MAPKQPSSKAASGPPSPVKTPRHSAEKRTSSSHKKRNSANSEKRRSVAEQRISYTSDQDDRRRSTPSSSRRTSPRKRTATITSGPASSTALSADSLARLDAQNDKETRARRSRNKVTTGRVEKSHRSRKERVVSEKTEAKRGIATSWSERFNHRGGFLPQDRKKRRILCLAIAFVILLVVVLVPVGVLVIGKQNNSGSQTTAAGGPSNGNLNGVTVPDWAKGTYYDPFTWYDTQDFNVSVVTNETVGGLPIMGLNSTWDDTVQANPNVPPLNQKFAYGKMPIRGINVGGWLAIEPFVTPSFFNAYPLSQGVVDEYTLTKTLGPSQAAATLEKHYSSFINAQSFADIRNAGFDHVRMPFSYWAVVTYPGDPYVAKISWRYLLRGIEYARQNGLRVNLDLHAVPGSQNGWNHSGRQGVIGWLNGTDGALNGQRSLDIHNQLSQFFAQPRYENVVGIYGLVNEPKMISLPTETVLNWTTSAISIVRGNGINQTIVFGDGFLGIPNWQGKLQGIDNIVMDAHQYTIFNTGQISMDHQTKLTFACAGWSGQMELSINPATGFGPTLCGEWSQADTDCTPNLNNVGIGSRWEGNMNLPDPSSAVLQPCCPNKDSTCSCSKANADPSDYSNEYKTWLLSNAIGQMTSFEIGYGWFYWTWITETATQWSWKLGMEAGIVPQKVWDRSAWNCSMVSPNFTTLGLPEYY